jgi:hypothetical protein
MMKIARRLYAASVLALLFARGASAADGDLQALERAYADMNDAYGALGFVQSGFVASYEGKNAEQWAAALDTRRAEVERRLGAVREAGLAPTDVRAVKLMREGYAQIAEEGSLAPTRKCADAQRRDLAASALAEALYACFDELANNIQFEGATLTRVGAFDQLTRIEEPERRKALFYAFVPLWRAVNGDSEPDSPYRRRIVAAAADARTKGSAIDAAAKTVGVSTDELERWLERILDAWREANDGPPMEPWDYRHAGGAADREIGDSIPLGAMLPINERFYADLGAKLAEWDVVYDLKPRSGKAPLAYADYIRRGRMRDGSWRPTRARVSANYARGGLGPLNEFVHENGHIAQMMALRTRPAFMDLGDPVFYEAFADVPSWSTYEPAWQKKYLGRQASESASLRALYSGVMLDVAWALFDARMLREPTRDPNAVWTEISSKYLNVRPHAELSWWAVRVQLVDKPGYMVNYGLGAVITAHIRDRIGRQLGAFDAGEPRWFDWLSRNLLASGYEKDTATLLREFLGGPVSVEPLLGQLRRMKSAGAAGNE